MGNKTPKGKISEQEETKLLEDQKIHTKVKSSESTYQVLSIAALDTPAPIWTRAGRACARVMGKQLKSLRFFEYHFLSLFLNVEIVILFDQLPCHGPLLYQIHYPYRTTVEMQLNEDSAQCSQQGKSG